MSTLRCTRSFTMTALLAPSLYVLNHTFCLLAAYSSLHDLLADILSKQEIPASLKKLMEAMENRPKVKEHIAKREAARGS